MNLISRSVYSAVRLRTPFGDRGKGSYVVMSASPNISSTLLCHITGKLGLNAIHHLHVNLSLSHNNIHVWIFLFPHVIFSWWKLKWKCSMWVTSGGWLLLRSLPMSWVLYSVHFCSLKCLIIYAYPVNSICWCVLIHPTIDRFLIGFIWLEILLLALILTRVLAEVDLSCFPTKPLPIKCVPLTLPLHIVFVLPCTNTTSLEGLGAALFPCLDCFPPCSGLLRLPLSIFCTQSVCLGSGWVLGPSEIPPQDDPIRYMHFPPSD